MKRKVCETIFNWIRRYILIHTGSVRKAAPVIKLRYVNIYQRRKHEDGNE